MPTLTPVRLLAACFSLAFCASSWAADWTLPDLMRQLAQQKSGKATFTEKKYLSLLDKPLESSGELSFDAPDRLEKRTLKPKAEALVLEGDRLTVTLADKRPINLRLQDRPDVAAVVESMRGTLNGDLTALQKIYSVDFSGSSDKWLLLLTPTPTQSGVAKILRQIRIAGSDANIRTISFEQADGDRSEMTISKVVTP